MVLFNLVLDTCLSDMAIFVKTALISQFKILKNWIFRKYSTPLFEYAIPLKCMPLFISRINSSVCKYNN